jgi:hypothetical protein
MALHSAAVQLGSTRRETPLPPGAPFHRRLWHGWQRVARWLGNLLSRIVTTLAFVVVLPVFAVFIRLFSDPMELKDAPPHWTPLPPDPGSIDESRRGT